MANVIYKFRTARTMYSTKLVVDESDSFMLAPGVSKEKELEVGNHTIHASIPFQGNETSVVTAQINVKSNMSYEITYHPSAISGAGTLIIKEIPARSRGYRIDSNGRRVEDKRAAIITKARGSVHSVIIARFVRLVVVAVVLIFVVYNMTSIRAFRFPSADADIKYVNEPFTLTEPSLRRITEIESVEIKSVEGSTIGELMVTFELVGVLEGDDYLRLEVKCYDEDDFLLETASLTSSVTSGEKFKVSEWTWMPEKTARIEFVKD